MIYPMLQLICFRHYADDINMFATGKDIDYLVSNLNKTLLNVSDWLKANKLSINVKKTLYGMVPQKPCDE